MATMTTAEKLALLDRFFAAIQAGDLETVRACYAPDAQIWHNNDNAIQGPAENLPVLRWVSTNIKGMRYDDVRRTVMEDGRVFQQHVLRGTAPNGQPLEVFACIVFSFGGGCITRLDEYLDTGQTAVLRG